MRMFTYNSVLSSDTKGVTPMPAPIITPTSKRKKSSLHRHQRVCEGCVRPGGAEGAVNGNGWQLVRQDRLVAEEAAAVGELAWHAIDSEQHSKRWPTCPVAADADVDGAVVELRTRRERDGMPLKLRYGGAVDEHVLRRVSHEQRRRASVQPVQARCGPSETGFP